MSTTIDKTDYGGLLGAKVTLSKKAGKIVVKNRPKQTRDKQTAPQVIHQKKFKAAVSYAKRQMADAVSKALYAAGITKKNRSAFSVALTDFLSAPMVNSINHSTYRGVVGDKIVIDATDDFMVSNLTVTITSASGDVIETGDAVALVNNPRLWTYTATAANAVLPGTTIAAMATDKPGNTGTAQVVL